MILLAHLGHWLWVFYVLPILFVIGGILWSSISSGHRESKDEGSSPAGGTERDPENGGEAPARRGPSR